MMKLYSMILASLILLITISILIPITSGMGLPHLIYGYIYDSPEASSLHNTVTVHIQTRPEEKLTNTTFRWENNRSQWLINTGNFPTPWKGGETLVIEVTTPHGGFNHTTMVLDQSAVQQAPDIITPEKTWIERSTIPMVVAAILIVAVIVLLHIKRRRKQTRAV